MTARTLASGLAVAGALAGLSAAVPALGNELEGLEVTMEVVDNPAELGELMSGLRAPRVERVLEPLETAAGNSGRGAADAAEQRSDATVENRPENRPDDFDDDFLNESSEADFEYEDSFEEGEIVDVDLFDELPAEDMGDSP